MSVKGSIKPKSRLRVPLFHSTKRGAHARPYSAAIALVNPTNVSRVVALPAGVAAWKDLYGAAVPDPTKVTLAPASGLVLLKA